MNEKVTIIFFLLFSTLGFSQQRISFSDGSFQNGQNYNNLFLNIDDELDSKTVGARYINENFLPAKLNNSKDTFFLRYDAFNEVFEVKKGENKYSLNKKISDLTISFQNGQVYKPYNYEGSLKYFSLLNDENSKIKLLKKESIIFIEEKESKTGYDEYRPPQYKRKKDSFFYINESLNEPIEIPNNKKKFAELFHDNQKDILDYIKKEKIKLNDENDLIKLFSHMNSI